MYEIPNKFVYCPTCNTQLDGATGVSDEAEIPQEGDVSFCFSCGEMLEYEEGYFVHKMSKQKLYSIKILQPDFYEQLMYIQTEIKKNIDERKSSI